MDSGWRHGSWPAGRCLIGPGGPGAPTRSPARHLQASRMRDDRTGQCLGCPLEEGVTERSPLLRLLLSGGARTPRWGDHMVRRIRALAPRPDLRSCGSASRSGSLQHPSSGATGVCLRAGRLNVQLAARAWFPDRVGTGRVCAQPAEDVGHTAPLTMAIVLRTPWRPPGSANRGNRCPGACRSRALWLLTGGQVWGRVSGEEEKGDE